MDNGFDAANQLERGSFKELYLKLRTTITIKFNSGFLFVYSYKFYTSHIYQY